MRRSKFGRHSPPSAYNTRVHESTRIAKAWGGFIVTAVVLFVVVKWDVDRKKRAELVLKNEARMREYEASTRKLAPGSSSDATDA